MERVRILIADDEPILAESLRRLLESYDLDVIARASNGAEAVALASRLNPDVVIMDVRMPIMDGLEAMREIKAKSPKIQIIVLSAYDDAALEEEAQMAGAFDYLVKGESPRKAIESIKRAAVGRPFQRPSPRQPETNREGGRV